MYSDVELNAMSPAELVEAVKTLQQPQHVPDFPIWLKNKGSSMQAFGNLSPESQLTIVNEWEAAKAAEKKENAAAAARNKPRTQMPEHIRNHPNPEVQLAWINEQQLREAGYCQD